MLNVEEWNPWTTAIILIHKHSKLRHKIIKYFEINYVNYYNYYYELIDLMYHKVKGKKKKQQ